VKDDFNNDLIVNALITNRIKSFKILFDLYYDWDQPLIPPSQLLMELIMRDSLTGTASTTSYTDIARIIEYINAKFEQKGYRGQPLWLFLPSLKQSSDSPFIQPLIALVNLLMNQPYGEREEISEELMYASSGSRSKEPEYIEQILSDEEKEVRPDEPEAYEKLTDLMKKAIIIT